MKHRPLIRLAQILVICAAAVAVVLSVIAINSRRAARHELQELLHETGLADRQPDAAEYVLREPDPVQARMKLARAMMDECVVEAEDIGNPELVRRQVELAHKLAVEVTERRPAMWQAWLLVGTSTYRGWLLDNDQRIVTERSTWREPVEHALELAPGQHEVRGFLAATTIELWPVLDDEEKARGRELLRESFEDVAYLRAMLEPWLELIPDRDEALAVVPDRPDTWSVVLSHYASTGDREGYGEARRRWQTSLQKELPELQATLDAALAGQDPDLARSTAQRIVGIAPPDLRWRDIVADALRRCPPGPTSGWIARGYAGWLEWGLDGFVRNVPLFDSAVFDRLRNGAGELPEATNALALLASDKRHQAAAAERWRDDLNTEAWAPYSLAKARSELARGDRSLAGELLRTANRGLNHLPEAQRLRLQLTHSEPLPESWWQEIPGLARERWSAVDWRWRGKMASLDFVAAREAPDLDIALDVVPENGAVVELALDFETLWVGSVMPGNSLTVEQPIAPGPHLMQLTRISGGNVAPGTVELGLTPEDSPENGTTEEPSS